MATMRTQLSGGETPSEKKLWYIFRNHFSDDYHVWHNTIFHNLNGLEVDFIVIHPYEGIYLIEVKDWQFYKIRSADQNTVIYESEKGIKSLTNPFKQALNNTYKIRSGLEKIPCFLHSSGKYQNKLVVAINHCVAFPYIYASQLEPSPFANHLPSDRILDEAFFSGKALSDRDYEKLLLKQKERDFNFTMSDQHWFEINKFLGTPVITDPISNTEIGVVDEIQESLITLDIDKQLLIEGPAGSGKSVILIKRAAYMLEQNPTWKIGLLCYNIIMANYLGTLAETEGLYDKLHFHNFGELSKTKNNEHSFDAILIDEGQDLNEHHLSKARHLLNPTTNSLTICYDPNQALYSRDDLELLLSSSGFRIDFEKKLVKQQRSIHFALALAFYNALTNQNTPLSETLIETYALLERYFLGYKNPQTAIASGTARHFSNNCADRSHNIFRTELEDKVQLLQFNYVKQMIHHFAETIKELCSHSKAKFSDFMIIYPWAVVGKQPISKYSAEVLQSHDIPYRILASKSAEYFNVDQQLIYDEKNNLSSASLTDNVVKVSNVYQSKGQDAKYVAIIGFENIIKIPSDQSKSLTENQVIQQTAARAYVLITRATSKLFIYHSEDTAETKLLSNILLNI